MKRDHRRAPNKTEREAACLLMLKRGDGTWLIPEPTRSKGTAEEICASVQYHHEFPDALGGNTDPRNLTPLTKPDHAVETSTRTIKTITHSRKQEEAEADFRRRLLVKGQAVAEPKEERRRRRFRRKMSGEIVDLNPNTKE